MAATRDLTKTDSRLAARCAAVASLGAAVIHFAVVPMHWRDWLPSGVFFAALATFQLLWAYVAWSRPGTLVLAAGIAANLGAAGLWVTSCLVGSPVGPSAGQPEPVGAAGIMVLLMQCYVVMGSAWAWSRRYQPEEISGFGRALVLIGANTVMAAAVTVGLAASLQGHHSHQHGPAVEAQGEHHDGHEAHMEGRKSHADSDTQPERPHHPVDLQSPPVGGSATPVPEDGLPVTDMGLDDDGEQDRPHPTAPSGAGVTKPTPPSAQPEPAQSEPDQPVQADSDDSELEADGHQHHHDD